MLTTTSSQGFGGKFERGECPGWAREQVGAMAHTGAHLDLSAFSSPEELSTLGLDRLKSALIALGLKCGGTLQVGSADTDTGVFIAIIFPGEI